MIRKIDSLSRRAFARSAFGLAGGCAAAAALLSSGARPAAAATYGPGERRCATCDFWKGERTLSADRTTVSVADDAKGLCSNPDSPLYNERSRHDQVFKAGWTTWSELA
jgi:hypothetical protein